VSAISPRNGSVAGLAMAAGAIGFAGLTVVEGNPKPDVFGLKFLAMYAQPRRGCARDRGSSR
jgi:hypothetical protein